MYSPPESQYLTLVGQTTNRRLRVGLKLPCHRFSLHRFGQGTILGVHRWLVLSLMSFILALWGYWISGFTKTPDWGVAAQTALEFFFPSLVLSLLLLDIERLKTLALEQGFDIQVSRCKI